MGDTKVEGYAPAVNPRDGAPQDGEPSPGSWERALSDVIEITAVLGEPECARRILDFHCHDAVDRHWGTLPKVTVLRHRALLAAMTGDHADALHLLETLPDRIETEPDEVARALLMRGALRILTGRRSDGRTDVERAARLFLTLDLIDWCDACLRTLAVASAGRGPQHAGEVASVLTGGYWGHHEVATVLRRALNEVDAQLRALSRAPLPAV